MSVSICVQGVIPLSWYPENKRGDAMKKYKNVVAASFFSSLPAFIVVAPLLASCASSGLYNMSDEWCARNLDATAARRPENQELAHRPTDTDIDRHRSHLARHKGRSQTGT